MKKKSSVFVALMIAALTVCIGAAALEDRDDGCPSFATGAYGPSGTVSVIGGDIWAGPVGTALPGDTFLLYEDGTFNVEFIDGDKSTSIAETVGSAYVLPPEPTRDGYGFGGWFTDRGGRGDRITEETIVSADDAKALYAKWTFDVTFMDGDKSASMTETVGSAYVLPPEPTRDGYGFGGWFTEKGGLGDKIDEKVTAGFGDATTLYAMWTFGADFFDCDVPTAVTQTVDLTFVLPERPEKQGFDFGGWFTGKGGQGDKIDDTVAVTFASAKALYAEWSCDVIFIDDDKQTTKTETADLAYVLPTDPVREGYGFGGWYTENGGQGDKIDDTVIFTCSGAKVLYAKWTFDVEFIDGDKSTSITETVGSAYVLPPEPTRDGYGFGGWFTGKGGSGLPITAKTVAAFGDATSVYAKWTFGVEFDERDEVSTVTETVDTDYILPGGPSKEGYDFGGWYTEKGGKGHKIDENVTVSLGDAKTLYAKWIFKVTLMDDEDPTVIDQTAESEYALNEPEREGFAFGGWYTEKGGKGDKIDENVTAGFGDATTLYAKWTFGVTFIDGDIETPVNETADLAYVLSKPSAREDCVFGGWFTEKGGLGGKVDENVTVSLKDAKTLYAMWTFDVVLDARDARSTVTETVDLEYVLTDPERQGFTFGGWFTEKGGEGQRITVDDIVDFGDARTLYAKWTFGAAFVDEDKSATVTETVDLQYVLPYPDPVREGYAFGGWFTEKGGTGDKIDESVTFGMGSAKAAYAKWTFEVTFMDGYAPTVTEETVWSEYVLPEQPEREGFVFGGWFTEKGGQGQQITVDDTVKFGDAATLYAKWTFDVTFTDANIKTPVTETVDLAYVLPAEPVRQGFVFGGWFTEKGGDGQRITVDDTVDPRDAKTLYAKWTFGAAFVDGDKSVTVTETVDQKYVLPETEPVKEGYAFGGWFTGEGGKGQQITGGDTAALEGPRSFYAKWTFEVTFMDGYVPTVTEETVWSEYVLPEEPAEEGYFFGGWFTEKGGKGDKIDESVIVGFGDVRTLYAKWTFDVTFTDGNIKTPVTETVDLAYVLPAEPVRQGFVFGGWFTEKGGDGQRITVGDTVDPWDAKTLYAKWTFGAAFVDGDKSVTVTETVDQKYVLPETEPVKEGYAFGGWFTVEGGKGQQITGGDTAAFEGPRSFYAKWTFEVTLMNGNISAVTDETVGSEYVLPEPVREGYFFGGWFTEIGGLGDKIDETVTAGFGDARTLYAKWTFDVTFTDGDTPIAVNETVDLVYVLPAEPEREGFVFGGWFTEKGGDGQRITVDDTVGLNDARALYAKWTFVAVFIDDDASKNVTETVDLKYDLPEPGPAREGYAFGGWFTDRGGKGQQITVDDTAALEGAKMFYAKWTFEVAFMEDADTKTVVEETVGSEYVLPGSKPVREGYTFGGWFTEIGGMGDEIVDTVFAGFGDAVTLYAKWTFGVTFTDGDTPNTVNETVDLAYVLPAEPAREGYAFGGWFTEKGGLGKQIDESITVKFGDAVTLYAKWTFVAVFIDDDTSANITETVDLAYVLPDPGPAREGFAFGGWFTETGGKGDEITAEGIVALGGAHYIYAKWTFDVTFTDGDIETPVNETAHLAYVLPEQPVRDGYVFGGWFTEKGGKGVQVDERVTVSLKDAKTLYAMWTFDVTFMDGDIPIVVNETADLAYVLPEQPEREGWVFGGWFTGKGGLDDKVDESVTVSLKDAKTLYAKWTFSVTFVFVGEISVDVDETADLKYVLPELPEYMDPLLRGWFTEKGGMGDKVDESVTVGLCDAKTLYAMLTFDVTFTDGDKTTTLTETVDLAYALPEQPVRKGYVFGGWFTEKGGMGDRVDESVIVKLSDAKTLYAKWTFDVTFTDGDKTTTLTETVDLAYELPDEPSRKGYTFGGWFTEKGGDGQRITVDDTVKFGDATTLYAKWTFDVSFIDEDIKTTLTETVDLRYALPVQPEKEGFVFGGWFTYMGGKGDRVDENTVAGLEDTGFLYAKWTFEIALMDGNIKTVAEVTVWSEYVLPEPVREGFVFGGWFTEKGGQGNKIDETVTAGFGDTRTLYAKWTFDVTFMDGDIEKPVTETVDLAYELPDEPSRKGYTFGGWFTEKGGQGQQITVDDTVKFGDAATLYAKWTFDVTFIDGDNTTTLTETADLTYVLPQQPVREGYDFGGWFTEKGGKGDEVFEGRIVALGDVRYLYAKWTFDVTFTDGDIETPVTETVHLAYVLPEQPEKKDLIFGGWFTGEKGEGDRIDENVTVMFGDATTLYAKWTFVVTFTDGDIETPVSETVGQAYVLPEPSVREGCVFGGWFTEKGGNGVQIEDTVTVKLGDAATLYAKWTFDVIFTDRGTETAVNETADLAYLLPEQPERQNFIFGGWFTKEGGQGDKVDETVTVKLGDAMTVYAAWTFDVTFTDRGTPILKNETVGSNYVLPEVVREGYDLLGWFTEKGGKGDKIDETVTVASGDARTLYAEWKARECSVSFNANGGELSGEPTASATYDQVFEFGQTASRKGYSFEGWYTSETGGEKVVSGDTWKIGSDTVLYAHWKKDSNLVWYAVGGIAAAIAVLAAAFLVIRRSGKH